MDSYLNAYFDFEGETAARDAEAVADALGGRSYGGHAGRGEASAEVDDAYGWSWDDVLRAMRGVSGPLSRSEGHVVLRTGDGECYADVSDGEIAVEESELVRVPSSLPAGVEDMGDLRVAGAGRDDAREFYPFFVDARSVPVYALDGAELPDGRAVDAACRDALGAGADALCGRWADEIADMLDGGDDRTPASRVKQVALARACASLGSTLPALADAIRREAGLEAAPSQGPAGLRADGRARAAGKAGAVRAAVQSDAGPAAVDVAATVSPGAPSMRVLGVDPFFSDSVVSYIRAGLRAQGFSVPRAATLIDVSPGLPAGAHVRDVGLAAAAAVLLASGQIPEASAAGRVFCGALDLGGTVRGDRAAQAAGEAVARSEGLTCVGAELGGLRCLRDPSLTERPKDFRTAQAELDADIRAAAAASSGGGRSCARTM